MVRGQTFLSFGKAGLALTKKRKILEMTISISDQIDRKKEFEGDIVKDSESIVKSIDTQSNEVNIIKDSKNIVKSIETQVDEVDEIKKTDKEKNNNEI